MTFNLPDFTKGNLAGLNFTMFNEMFAILRRVEPLLPKLETLARERRRPPPRQWFFGEITGHTLIPGHDNRWLYSWRKVLWNPNEWAFQPLTTAAQSNIPPGKFEPSGIVDDPAQEEIGSTIGGDPFALAAVNGCESPNTESGIVGPGVNTGSQSYQQCNLTILPIMDGVVVPIFSLHGILGYEEITSGRSPIAYMFCIPNAHDRDANP